MRILHTSDWHLGRSLHGLDLLPFQREFCEAIIDIAQSSDIDCVLIAGDIFDKALAPIEAVRLFSETLARLADCCSVIVTSGNHDSAVRLGAGASLFRPGVHVITEPTDAGTGIDLEVDGVLARIYPVPYLDPDHCRHALAGDGVPLPRSHEAVMGAAVDAMRTFDAAKKNDSGNEIQPDIRIIVAHAFVLGGERSESERDIAVGGVDAVPSAVFDGFDYVALGHLHGPQEINGGGSATIRYSGSPLRYSFAEGSQTKSVTVLEVGAAGVTSVEQVAIPQARQMITLTGPLSEIVSSANPEKYRDAWVRVIATDAARPPELLEVVRSAYPNALSIIHQPTRRQRDEPGVGRSVDLRDPLTISRDFIRHVTSATATDSEVSVIRTAYEAARDRDSA